MFYRTLALLFLTLPLIAQDRSPFRRVPHFPPEIISQEYMVRDVAKLDRTHVKIDTENASVRVLRISLAAGLGLPSHDDPDGVLVCLSDCHITLINASGSAHEMHLTSGQTRWIAGERRKTVNTGKSPVEFLYIEQKLPRP